MKKLKFIELWVLSAKEKAGRSIKLSENVTAIVADNEFGKSCLIKSLYYALGAEPRKTPESWANASVSTLLHFSLDMETYFILRYGTIFSLFDSDGQLLWTVSGITKGLGPKLASLFDFNVEVQAKSGELMPPVPALCFMPFYIDQDKGWTESWESFTGVGFYASYKDVIADFHTGRRPKEYYEAKSRRDEAIGLLTNLRRDGDALSRAKTRVETKRSSLGTGFDPELFAKEIDRLLAEQNRLQAFLDEVKCRISELQSARTLALEEMAISKRILDEYEGDIKFLKGELSEEIVCPTCNTVHANDFANRYGLINDADACREVYSSSLAKLERLNAQIKQESLRLGPADGRFSEIESLLESRRGEVRLYDMLRDQSDRMLDQIFAEEEAVLDGEVGRLSRLMEVAAGEMKEIENPKRKKEILDFYALKFAQFCRELDVTRVPAGISKKIRPTISEPGSSQSRIFLAYYYAILHTISKFSTSTFFPIVIDTPKQQDPDDKHAERTIRFIVEARPAGSQLVLATGKMHEVQFDGVLFEPDEKYSVLSEALYADVHAFMEPFVKSAIS